MQPSKSAVKGIPRAPTKSAALRALLESGELEFLMEAHNGLSARIVEEAGFKGIWASGLALSAAFGVCDSNEASWTQVLETVEFMADATTVPILLDGDTGYGNFNNLRRLVGKLEQRGVAGVCIEDKIFPKTNSFINGGRQALADIDEFRGKIRAGKEAQRGPDFCIVARVEALIAGWGVDAAIERAEAYRRAGADAILIHTARSQPDEILAFARAWDRRAPLVIVPTKYYSTPTAVFRRAGIDLVIWANHMLRTAITSMQRTAAEVADHQALTGVEDRIAPVAEVFRLQGDDELRAAERRYAGPAKADTRAVVLAASRGAGLEALTETRPKAMLEVAGKPLLRRLVDLFKGNGIDDVTVVAGYRPDAIDTPGVSTVENPDYASTGELVSLACASDALGADSLLLYGDLIFRAHVLRDLLDMPDEITVVVDSDYAARHGTGHRDPAWCSVADDRSLFQQDVHLKHVGTTDAPAGAASGRWIGLARVRGAGRDWLNEAMAELRRCDDFAHLGVPALLNHLVDRGRPVKVLYIAGHWLDVNDLEDVGHASDFAYGGAA